jgi:hypothetical protein
MFAMALQHLETRQCIAVGKITSKYPFFRDTAANWSGYGGRGEEAAMKDIDPLFLMNNKRSVNGDKAGK